ncbi:MAG: sirohydrochlorin cobaltochelatase [Angelakisella sp.]
MSKAILVVSFGTTFSETRQKNITAVEATVAAKFPGFQVYSAWTSSIIRRILAERGEHIPDVTQAMDAMRTDGVTEVVILPTHLLYGEEYDKLCTQSEAQKHLFHGVRIAPPLLAGTDDMRTVLEAVTSELPMATDESLVFMGHGTPHFCNTVYAALDYLAKAEGRPYVFVGTVEAFPDLNTVITAVKAAGYRKAVLTPLMLVAGDHAVNDMASLEPDSWKSCFEAAGIDCRTVVKGLGEYEKIRQLYAAHLETVL